jgi:biopolymer transport protein ExbB/TolQ
MGIDLQEIWEHMSWVVRIITILMLGMSVWMFYVIAERLLTFRAASDQSIRYVQALGEFLRQHKVNEALTYDGFVRVVAEARARAKNADKNNK